MHSTIDNVPSATGFWTWLLQYQPWPNALSKASYLRWLVLIATFFIDVENFLVWTTTGWER